MEDYGDRVVVTMRPRRVWGGIAFLVLWLALWTVGGAAAIGEVPNEPFVLLWLVMWFVGEVLVAVWIAWELAGVIRLTATPSLIEVRKEIGGFGRTRRYESALVSDVAAVLVPADEDEGRRRDYCVRVSQRDETAHVGEGLTANQAEAIATRVLELIRPRAWWDAGSPRPRVYVEPPPEPDQEGWWTGVLWIAALVVLAVVADRL